MYNLHNKLINLANGLEDTKENKAVKETLYTIAEDVRKLTAKFEETNLENQKIKARRNK